MQHFDGLSRIRRAVCKPIYFSFLFFLFSLLVSCVSVKYVAIEQFVPAPFPLPEGMSIAVLNNLSPHNVSLIDSDVYAYSFDGDSLMEHVAQAFADAELFSEVVVLDSCIYPQGDTIFHLLSEPEVRHLCDILAVDMLYVCDYGCVTSWGPEAIDGERKTYLASHLYVPDGKESFKGIELPHPFIFDQILRRGTYRTRYELNRWKERSYPIVSQMAVECFAPHWESRDRLFYHGTSRNLREATVCVRDGNWDGAYRCWQQQAQKRSPRQRLISLYNQALYHEMNDSVDLALSTLDQADTYATDTTAVDTLALREWFQTDFTIGNFPYTDHQRIVNYRTLLRERKEELQKLDSIIPNPGYLIP
ncbi:MAG: hypothetical protein J6T64_07680 [Bacteroidaceae bacterium]|nr:hypothetical protein [Bacteroidaceae bacterium]